MPSTLQKKVGLELEYEKGFDDGYVVGFEDGGGNKSLKEICDESWDDGYEEGNEDGYFEGYDYGYEKGFYAGSVDGYQQAHNEITKLNEQEIAEIHANGYKKALYKVKYAYMKELVNRIETIEHYMLIDNMQAAAENTSDLFEFIKNMYKEIKV